MYETSVSSPNHRTAPQRNAPNVKNRLFIVVDVDAAVRFIQAIHGHERAGFAILMLKRGDMPPLHYGFDLGNPQWDILRRVLTNYAGADCYFGVATYASPPQAGMQRRKEMVLHSHWLICEADEHPRPAGMPTPTFVVETSAGRFQFWWRMDRPLTVAQFENYAGRIAAIVGCNVVKDAARVLRVPGTRNHKPGRDGFIVRVVAHNPAASHSLAAFDNFLGVTEPIACEAHPHRAAPPVEQILAPGVRHTALLSLAGTLRRRGCAREEILALIEAVNARRCQPPLSGDELSRIAASACRYPPASELGRGPRPPEGREGASVWDTGTVRRISVAEAGKDD